MAEKDSPIESTSARFGYRFLTLLGFFLPFSYFATVAAVVVHEVLGHGGIAIVLGGEFRGFGVRWDTMGWAYSNLPPETGTSGRAIKLAGGGIATTLFGTLFLWGAYSLRKGLFLPIGLAIAASCFGLNSSIYMFWSSWLPNPPGDFARIIRLTDSSVLRWMFLSLGFILTVVFTYLPLALLVRVASRWLFDGQSLAGARRAAMPMFIGTSYALGQVVTDWNHLVRDIGMLPRIAGVFVGVATLIALWMVPLPAIEKTEPFRRICLPMAIAWGLLFTTLLLLGFFLVDGVSW